MNISDDIWDRLGQYHDMIVLQRGEEKVYEFIIVEKEYGTSSSFQSQWNIIVQRIMPSFFSIIK